MNENHTLYIVLGILLKLANTILLLPSVTAYVSLLQIASIKSVPSVLLGIIGGAVHIAWMALVIITTLLFNDSSFKPTLPWGSKPMIMQICIILQKYFLSSLLLYKSKLFLGIIHLLIIGIAIISLVSYSDYYGTHNTICKICALINITLCIWFSICSTIRIFSGCSLFSLIPSIASYPLLIFILYFIKCHYELQIIKKCSVGTSKHLKWFYLYFTHLMDNFADRSISSKCSFLAGMILKHQIECKNPLCPCGKIDLKNLNLKSSNKLSSDRSLFFEKSQSLDSLQHSQENFEDIETKKKCCDEEMLKYFEFILKAVCKINPLSALPLIYSSYFHLYIKENYFEALFDLEKCSCVEFNFYEQFCIYHTK